MCEECSRMTQAFQNYLNSLNPSGKLKTASTSKKPSNP